MLGLPEGGSSSKSPGPGGSRQLPESRDRLGSVRPSLGSLSPLQEGCEGVHRLGPGEAEVPYPVQVADSPPMVRRGTRIRN